MTDESTVNKLPTSRSELYELLDIAAETKRKLVDYVSKRHRGEIRKRLIAHKKANPIALNDFALVVEGIIYDMGPENGDTVVDRFVRDTPRLTPLEAEIALGWRESVLGVFQLEHSDGPIVRAVNLVDDLPYRLVSNDHSPEIARKLANGGFLLSRITPLFDAWMMSGHQSILEPSEKLYAYGLAAETAQKSPRLFFRNPENLKRALEREHEKYRQFIERFGAPWVVGTAREIEERCRELMWGDMEAGAKLAFRLPQTLQDAATVGMIQDPSEGMYFLEDFGIFLDALDDPSQVEMQDVRKVLLGYMESPGVSPAIFGLAAKERPSQLNELLQHLLDHPGFDWEQDGQACLKEHNPAFFETPRLPSTLLMNGHLLDGLRFMKQLDAERAASHRTAPKIDAMSNFDFAHIDDISTSRISQSAQKKSKEKRKHARKARRRSRR